ncbi:MAG: hypothetical protein M1594_01560 [Candidatus Marsarchaeota archaeon]|nr:hypothetical protein [Candidatus Marsarchaeota archaeon]
MRKSQESAPIELVIAVIIMVMSITLAFTVWSNIQTTQCTNQIQSEMMTLENAVVDVSLGSPPTQRVIYINFPTCGNYNIQAIRFSHYGNPAYCGSCPISSTGCWILEPLSFNTKTGFSKITDASVCVNLPSTVDFVSLSCPYDYLINNGTNSNNPSSCPPLGTVIGYQPSSQTTLNQYCNAPPPSQTLYTYATIGKGNQTQYKLTLSKGYAEASGTPSVQINMCLTGK